MKIVDQTWGDDEHKDQCSAYMQACLSKGKIDTYWKLYQLVRLDGADVTFNRSFKHGDDLPDHVKAGLLKVCRYMEYSQNIPILNAN